MKIQTKHIDRLSQSKKSGIGIGSRSIPHRLRKHEREQVNIAQKRGYLQLKQEDRVNVRNIWEEYRQAEEKTPWIAMKNLKEGTTIISAIGEEDYILSTTSPKEIYTYIQTKN